MSEGRHCAQSATRGRLRRSALALVVAGTGASAVMAQPAAAALPAECAQAGAIVTCTYSTPGSTPTFVVPDGVSSVHVMMRGGHGGASGTDLGGRVAEISFDLGVAATFPYPLQVGQNGADAGAGAGNGGAGGQGSATGGGGGGASVMKFVGFPAAAAGAGGGAGGQGALGTAMAGGAGGDAATGGGDGQTPNAGNAGVGHGGKAAADGTHGAGGAGGAGVANGGAGTDGTDGGPGSVGAGGAGGAETTLFGGGGGGGGGGYAGGGGGGAGAGGIGANGIVTSGGGGGGGGSSLVPTGGTSMLTSAAPEIVISYDTTPPSPAAISGTPPQGVTGTPYDFTYTVTGTPTPTVTLKAGTLPPGLSLSGVGHLSGTPTLAGTYTFTVEATNASHTQDLVSTVTVSNPAPPQPAATPPTLSGTPPSPALTGTSYDFTYTLGGTPTPTVTLKTGSLPAGLTLSPAGRLSGTPTGTGTFPFTVTATNPAGSQDLTSTITVNPAPTPPTIAGAPPSPVPAGTTVSFSYATTGTPAPTVAVSSGQLPPGLSLSPTGSLTGVATTIGIYTATLTATNASGAASTTSTLTVTRGPAARVVVVSGGGQSATVGDGFAQPLVVRTTDAYGNTVPGVRVRFAAPGTGASAILSPGRRTADVTSDAHGLASVTAKAVRDTGSFAVLAGGPGLTGTEIHLTDLAPITLGVGDTTVREGSGGRAVFAVRLSRALDVPITVDYTTTDGTATAPDDYHATTGHLTIPAGTKYAVVRVAVVNDTLDERVETFSLVLDHLRGARIRLADPVGVCAVYDND